MKSAGELSCKRFQNAQCSLHWNSYILWWGSEDKELAGVKFALKLAQFLKDNPNILATNTKSYFGNDMMMTTMAFCTQLTWLPFWNNCLVKNLKTVKERENYEMHSFLVSEAIGSWFATKVSSCYTMLKANVDVLICFLSSYNKP